MTQVQDYVLMIAGACLLCGGLTILAPDGHFERMVCIVGSVFLLVCMLSPLTSTVEGVVDYWSQESVEYTYQDQDVWDYSSQAMAKALEDKVVEYVVDVVGRSPENVTVDLSHNTEGFILESVCITVPESEMMRAAAIADYVAMRIGIRPSVIS